MVHSAGLQCQSYCWEEMFSVCSSHKVDELNHCVLYHWGPTFFNSHAIREMQVILVNLKVAVALHIHLFQCVKEIWKYLSQRWSDGSVFWDTDIARCCPQQLHPPPTAFEENAPLSQHTNFIIERWSSTYWLVLFFLHIMLSGWFSAFLIWINEIISSCILNSSLIHITQR